LRFRVVLEEHEATKTAVTKTAALTSSVKHDTEGESR